MKNKLFLIPIIAMAGMIIVVVLLSLSASGPDQSQLDKQRTANVTYEYKDKGPYGGYVAFNWLHELWKDQKPAVITRPFASAYTHNADLKNQGNVYIIVANRSFTDAADVRAMSSFISDGNTLVLAVAQPDSLLQATFGFEVGQRDFQLFRDSASIQKFLSPRLGADTTFAYNGFYSANYFTAVDTAVTTILGTNRSDDPNFITITRGNGHLLVLLNPLMLTNYFLLHKDNRKALENITTYVPNYVPESRIFWDEFYKKQTEPRQGDESEWSVLMRYKAMRWALWLTLLLALIYVAFESKRRQRIIPEILPLKNTSAEFVITLGKLYYQHHDNKNLAGKMVQHLMEYIRTRYYLNTQHLSEEFVEHLSGKSGYPLDRTRELIQYVALTRTQSQLSDEQLHAFYINTYQFYQNT